MTTYIGSLRFEGNAFTFWARHAAFVEIYSTAKIPKAGIPRVTVTFGYPRINGMSPPLKDALAQYNPSHSPACASASAAESTVVVEVGALFRREEDQGHHPLDLRIPQYSQVSSWGGHGTAISSRRYWSTRSARTCRPDSQNEVVRTSMPNRAAWSATRP